jgi:uncharacterized heparinase superfamily protein
MKAERALRTVGLRAASLVFRTPLYAYSLRGGAAPLAHDPLDPWPGDTAEAQRLLTGVWHLPNTVAESATPPWLMPLAPEDRAALHGFGWLRPLRAHGGDAARALSRAGIATWLDRFDHWHGEAWSPPVLADRLSAWLGAFHFFAAGADEDFRGRVLDSLQRQSRHLARVLPGEVVGADAIVAAAALALSGLCLAEGHARAAAGLALLDTALAEQILPDGCHIERRPHAHLRVFQALVSLRAVLRDTTNDVPGFLQIAIDRMAPMLRLWRHGDLGLAGFNGAGEGDAATIDKALALSDARGRALRRAPYGGFERLQAARGILLFDAGAPPASPFDAYAHAGLGSFEFSFGRDRMIVNCGSEAAPFEWRGALRQGAAHSAVQIGARGAIGFTKDGRVRTVPKTLAVERLEGEEGEGVMLSHDGCGGMLTRTLFLAKSGEDLRGEDRCEGPAGRAFLLRFHLHPEVQASLVQDARSVLLRLPGGSGWRFRTSWPPVRLEESVYCGKRRAGNQPRRSLQIVVEGTTGDGETAVQWAFQRERKATG